jgi:hypothetical protein
MLGMGRVGVVRGEDRGRAVEGEGTCSFYPIYVQNVVSIYGQNVYPIYGQNQEGNMCPNLISGQRRVSES